MDKKEKKEQEEEIEAEEESTKEKEHKKTSKEIELEKLKEIKIKEEQLENKWKEQLSSGQIIQKGVYFEAENFIKMVADGISTGCVILGSGGLGKSFLATTLLSKLKSKWIYLDSFSTPLALYITLFENSDKIIVLDDIQGVLENSRTISYLKSALWSQEGTDRVIRNLTTKNPKDSNGEIIENSFVFTGGIILLTNAINTKNPHINALLTRVNFVKIQLTYAQKLEILREIATNSQYKNLTQNERLICFQKIEELGKEIQRDLNFRTLIKLYQYYIFAEKSNEPELFNRLAEKLLTKQDEGFAVEVVKELQKREDLKTEQSKWEEFITITNLSRATYYRILKEKLGISKSQPFVEV